MKKIALTIVFCLLSVTGFSQSSTKTAKIQKLLELTGSGKMGIQVISTLLDSFQKQFPEVDHEFWSEMKKEVKAEELASLIAPLYEKYYTEEDLDQLIAFYQSPVGKKSIQLMPQIMQESMSIGQTWGKEIVDRVKKETKGERLRERLIILFLSLACPFKMEAMQKYKDKTGQSGVTAFEIGDDYIKIRFKTREVYVYNYSKPGKKQVEAMKDLALAGKGLSTFISQFVQDDYYSKS